MKHITNMIRETIRSGKLRKQYAFVEKCIREKAHLMSNLEFCRTMADFYTERVLEIDPNREWWDFADSKQKQTEFQQDFELYQKRIVEAEARIVASRDAFAAAQKELNEITPLD